MKSVAGFTEESIALFWAAADKTEDGCWRWKLYINCGAVIAKRNELFTHNDLDRKAA